MQLELVTQLESWTSQWQVPLVLFPHRLMHPLPSPLKKKIHVFFLEGREGEQSICLDGLNL